MRGTTQPFARKRTQEGEDLRLVAELITRLNLGLRGRALRGAGLIG
jgi:hypothetical protein